MNSAKIVPTIIIFLLLSDIIIYGIGDYGCQPGSPDSLIKNNENTREKHSYFNSFNDGKDNFYRHDSIFSFRSPKGYIPSLLYDARENITAPFHFKTKQWLITGAAAGITAGLILADNDIDLWARTQKDKHKLVGKVSPVLTQFGGTYGVCSVIAAGLVSAAFNNEKGVQTSLLATQAMITSALWSSIIKQLSGRERPKAAYLYSQIDGGKWNGLFGRSDDKLPYKRSGFAFDAFPSGHTATAFSIATVFATQYRDKKGVPLLCYTAAATVGISRLTEHEHWASDVFAGALLGYFSGKQVLKHFYETHQNQVPSLKPGLNNKPELTFIQDGNQIGLSIIW